MQLFPPLPSLCGSSAFLKKLVSFIKHVFSGAEERPHPGTVLTSHGFLQISVLVDGTVRMNPGWTLAFCACISQVKAQCFFFGFFLAFMLFFSFYAKTLTQR